MCWPRGPGLLCSLRGNIWFSPPPLRRAPQLCLEIILLIGVFFMLNAHAFLSNPVSPGRDTCFGHFPDPKTWTRDPLQPPARQSGGVRATRRTGTPLDGSPSFAFYRLRDLERVSAPHCPRLPHLQTCRSWKGCSDNAMKKPLKNIVLPRHSPKRSVC